MSITKLLKQIGEEVNQEVPNLNCGGCCVYAAKVGAALEKQGYEVKIIVKKGTRNTTRIGNDFSIRCPLQAEDTLPVSFDHVGVAVKVGKSWYTHDSVVTKRSTKTFGLWNDAVADVYFTVKQAKSFASVDIWNDCYPRRKGNSAINRIIKEKFSVVKKKQELTKV